MHSFDLNPLFDGESQCECYCDDRETTFSALLEKFMVSSESFENCDPYEYEESIDSLFDFEAAQK